MLKAGTAFVDIQPQIGAGFQGALASRLGPIGTVAGAVVGAGLAAGIGGAAVLTSIGKTFDDAFDSIRIGTGATGAALEELQADFKAVLTAVPTDATLAAAAITDISQRTGATGETLQSLAATTLNLSRITGEDLGSVIQSTTRLLGDWGVAVEDGAGALDALFRASQATGAPVAGLADLLVRYGAPLRQFGFGMEQSAALLGKFEKEGVNTELVMGSLRVALGKLARAGVDPVEGLKAVFEQIQNTGDVAEANALAIETFGARAGPDMAAAIREGRFALGELLDTVSGGGETIASAVDDTDGFTESWQRLKNRVLVAVEPLATRLIDTLDRLFETIGPKVGPVIEGITRAIGAVTGLFAGTGDKLDGLGGTLSGIAEAFGSAFRFVVDVVRSAVGAVSRIITDHGDTFRAIFSAVIGIVQRVGEVIKVVFDGLRAFWARWGDTILGVLGNVFGTVASIIRGALEVIKGIFDVILGILTGDWSRAWEGLKGIVSGVWNAVVGIVKGFVGNIITVVKGFAGNLGDSIRGGLERVAGFFRDLPGKIIGFLVGLPARMVELGADIIAGLIRGLGDIASRIFKSLKDGISNAISKVKSFLGIGSPSRVVADQLGLPLAQGVALGAEATGTLTAAALTTGIRTAADEAAGLIPSAFAGLTAGANITTTGAAANLPDAAAGTVINLEEGAIVINYPTPEPASTSIPRELRRLALTLGR